MTESTSEFTVWDYIVFALSLTISAGIGIFHACTGGHQKTTKEFLMANRSMSWKPVSLSLIATFVSAIALLGTPAEMYIYGTQYWFLIGGYFITCLFSAECFMPVFYHMKLTSAHEYLEVRFGSKVVRQLGAITFIVQMVIYMSIVLYAPSLALNAVTGLNVWVSVFSMGVVCTFYTTIGGMKAVMWTDVFQMFVIFTGLLTVTIIGSIEVGGFKRAFQVADEGGRIDFFNFKPDVTMRHTAWGVVIGGGFTVLSMYGVNQASVQRCLACKSLTEIRKAMWSIFPGLAIIVSLECIVGLVMYAVYVDCDPIDAKYITASDQLLPYFALEFLSFLPGLPGLFTACIFSGALSTVSSGLNSLAAITVEDIVKDLIRNDLSEDKYTRISKISAAIYGVIAIAGVVLAAELGGVLQAALSIFGMLGGPLLGLFALGIFIPWANKWGAIIGHVTAMVFIFWIGWGTFVQAPYVPSLPRSIDGCSNETLANLNLTLPIATTLPPDNEEIFPLYLVSYIWYTFIAAMVEVLIGTIFSFLTGPLKIGCVHPRLLCPWYYGCLKKYDPDQEQEKKIYDSNRDTEKFAIENHAFVLSEKTHEYDKGGLNGAPSVVAEKKSDLDLSPTITTKF